MFRYRTCVYILSVVVHTFAYKTCPHTKVHKFLIHRIHILKYKDARRSNLHSKTFAHMHAWWHGATYKLPSA
jgi:hypothetical protein